MSEATEYADETGIERPIKRVTGSTLRERLTDNAYLNILPARYLNKDENGELVENQEELFERVAKNVALAEVVFESRRKDVPVMVKPEHIKPEASDRGERAAEVFGISDDVPISDPEDVPSDIEDALEVLATTETRLTEDNVKHFAYDEVVPLVANPDVASHVEDTKQEFQTMMERLSFMPNSPTLMNAGDELQQLSACFVDSPKDDIKDIHETANQAAQVFQSGGGMGYSFSNLRPYGDKVGSTGGIASGPITFMRTYDQMCETIAQGGARRGAQMGIMRISHPDVIQFIHAKNKDVSLAHSLRLNDPDDFTHNSFGDALEEAREILDKFSSDDGEIPKHLRNAIEGHLSNFNISVGVTDGFMEAVKNGDDFTFTNPRTGDPHIATEETKDLYSWFDLGEHVEVGEPLSVPANEVWERIVGGAHENGEPGVVFLDKINDDHSFPVESTPTGDSSEYEVLATNPCGEQPLMEYEACNLGHINLSTIVAEDAPDWREFSGDTDYFDAETVYEFLEEALNYEELNRRIRIGTRFLDNVVTMSDFPIDKIEQTVADNRKIGLGVMGLAQMFIQMGVKYGSDESVAVARAVMKHINRHSKLASHDLAEERGPFANWEDSKYADPTEYPEWFERQTFEDAEEWRDGFPVRNHNTTTIAPTGTTSMVGNTTGGCEPVYNVAYYKNVSDDVQGDEMLVEFDDYFLRVLEANDIDVDAVKTEAEEQMAANEFDGIESLSTVPDSIAELFVTTQDLAAREHARMQVALQQGVDSSISKTINAPHDSTIDDAKDAFEYIYDHGGKGVTYYRDGTRSKQVLTTRADNTDMAEMNDSQAAATLAEEIEDVFGNVETFLEQEEVQETLDVSPDELLGETEFSEKKPRPDALSGISQRVDTGYGKVYVTINEDPETGEPFELFANIGQSGGFTNSFTEALAKVISTALRSGVDPDEVVDELQGTRSPKVAWDKGEQIQSIPDAIGTALLRYLKDDVKRPYPEQKTLGDTVSDNQDTNADADGVTDTDPNRDAAEDNNVEKEGSTDTTQDLIANGESPECPDCGAMTLYYSEGCKSCESCGWSEC